MKRTPLFYFMILIVGCAFIFSAIFGYQLFKETKTIATVMIDPGHGGYDVGSIGADGTIEKDMTLEIALRTGRALKNLNPDIHVVYTRTDDTVDWADNEIDDLAGRVALSQQQNTDYYLSIHLNASTNTSAYGYNAFIRPDDPVSKIIADNIETNLTNAGWQYNRGIQYTDSHPLYVVNNQSIPSMLFEVGFITNPTELTDLKNESNQELIANAIAKAYNDYIVTTIQTEPSSTSN